MLSESFKTLKIAAENDTLSFNDFDLYFNDPIECYVELLQALYWLERYVQTSWEKNNFTKFNVDEKIETLIEKIYTKLPFNETGTTWFGGITPSTSKNEDNLTSAKICFFNIYLTVAACSKNTSFINEMFKCLFYNISTPTIFCEAFMENDTRLICSLLAFLQIEKACDALSLNYQFVDLFVALVLQFQGNAGKMFVEFLATEAVMIPFVLRSVKYFNGKYSILYEACKRLKDSKDVKVPMQERIIFKRMDKESAPKLVFSINGLDETHRITIDKRIDKAEAICTSNNYHLNIAHFFHGFYKLVLDAHKHKRFPFKSNALVKCLQDFDSYISDAYKK